MARPDKLKLRPKPELVIALDDLDFSWFPHEVEKVKKLWGFGWHIKDIEKQVKRNQDEVAVLILHLARQDEIQAREGGILGATDYTGNTAIQ